MSRDKQRLVDYLAHILEAIERIERYAKDMNETAFLRDQMAQDAVIHNFEIIGEASHNILKRYPEFAETHAELPLVAAYQMRNAVAHGYFEVDLEVVWKTIIHDLPAFYQKVRKAVQDLNSDLQRGGL